MPTSLKELRELPIEAAAAIRGLVFDIDDTVTREGVLEAVAFKAMHRAAEAGIVLIAVSGRPIGWADVVARTWPVRMALGENGAGWVWRSGRGISEGYFSNETERAEQQQTLQKIRQDIRRKMPDILEANDQRARRCDAAFDVGETVQLPKDEVEALVSLIESHGVKSAVSSVHAHAIPGSWNKAVGVERALSEVLGIQLADELDRWAFVGDSSNDAAAFEFFSYSVGVANVSDHLHLLPSPPKYITERDRGRGFAELVDYLLKSRSF